MHEDDVGAMISDLERADALLVERKAVVQRSGVCIAYGRERLIEAAVHKLVYVPGQNLCMRLLLFGQLHVTRRRYIVIAINRTDELANHAAGIAST